jgi:hypothetical protein
LPPLLEPGDVRTWVTSQWKSPGRPGQFSAEINTRDGFDNALIGLADAMRGEPFGNDWRLNHVDIRVHFDVPGSRPVKVTVKVKPPASAIFKRHRFEDRILTLLRRNGLVHDHFAHRAAIAAE